MSTTKNPKLSDSKLNFFFSCVLITGMSQHNKYLELFLFTVRSIEYIYRMGLQGYHGPLCIYYRGLWATQFVVHPLAAQLTMEIGNGRHCTKHKSRTDDQSSVHLLFSVEFSLLGD